MLDQNRRLLIYRAQTINVRTLESARRQVQRTINRSLRINDEPAVYAHTRIYALMFCTWAESNFSKVIHTPHGFELDEIDQIKGAAAKHEVTLGWTKAVKLGLRHVRARKGNFTPNALQLLSRAIIEWVYKPSILRNKIVHGQWKKALNRKNDALQDDVTQSLDALTITQIDGWFSCHKELASMVEMLIESPERSFPRDWYTAVAKMEDHMHDASTRSLQRHLSILRRKPTGSAHSDCHNPV